MYYKNKNEETKAERANSKEVKKDLIEDEGIELSDDDLDQLSGGASFHGFTTMEHTR